MVKLSKQIKHSPNNAVKREELFQTKRDYKHLIRNKKLGYKTKLVEEMHLTRKRDVKQFWKIVNKLEPQNLKANTPDYNSADKWVRHFKSILNSKITRPFPPNSDNGPLDYHISVDELISASSSLKQGKSPGYDRITNEMISSTLAIYPQVFLSLFNHILKGDGAIASWNISILVPIF